MTLRHVYKLSLLDVYHKNKNIITMDSEIVSSSRCWLCEYNQEEAAIKLSRFIAENAAYMGFEQISNIVYEKLNELDPDGGGHTLPDVQDHIKNHVLTPSVKISGVLRSLVALLAKLESGLMTNGEDDMLILDSKNISIYLKVVDQILQIYKTGECERLMFGNTNGISGAPCENLVSGKRKIY